MDTGAVIVAAGLSSRMGEFKPMMSIGTISIAQRVVATFRQAGVGKIVVVTGHNAQPLERHLAKSGAVFLRNEAYDRTEMFDSAKIGLSYLRDKCDRLLFTPVDIPLFTAATVEALIASGEELACPVYDGEEGHPLMMSAAVVDEILKDSGTGGLKGAVSRLTIPIARVEVSDPGILHDADTPEDFGALLRYHNSQLIRPEVRVSLTKERPFFDERISMLLSLIDECASVRKACARMQISYSSGWTLINSIEEQIGYNLVNRRQGGDKGGGSELTPRARLLTETFRRFEEELQSAAAELFEEYFGGKF